MGHHGFKGFRGDYAGQGYRRFSGMSLALKLVSLLVGLIAFLVILVVALVIIRLLLEVVAPNVEIVQTIRDWLSSAIKSINPIQLLLGN